MSASIPTAQEIWKRHGDNLLTSREEIIALESWADQTRLTIEACLRTEKYEEAKKLGEQLEQCVACIAVLKHYKGLKET